MNFKDYIGNPNIFEESAPTFKDEIKKYKDYPDYIWVKLDMGVEVVFENLDFLGNYKAIYQKADFDGSWRKVHNNVSYLRADKSYTKYEDIMLEYGKNAHKMNKNQFEAEFALENL